MAHPSEPPAPYDVTQLFREHASRVERLLTRLGVRPCDVPDATQEVFVVAHRKRHAFEGRASVSTWLYRISVRVASAQRRLARHRRELSGDEWVAAAPSVNDVAEELERRALLEHVADALERLSEPQRTVLALHDLDGLSMREAATRLGIPAKTAFSRVYAARRALASELRRLGYAVPALLPLWPGHSIVAELAARVMPVSAPASWTDALAQWTRSLQRPGLTLGLPQAAGPLGIALCALLLSPHAGQHAAPRFIAARVDLPPPAAYASIAPSTSMQPKLSAAPSPSVSREPARAKPARIKKPLPAANLPVPAAAPEREPELEPAFIITHMGSENLRPVLPHPFASRVQSGPPNLPHMSARLAPIALEPELPASFD